MGNSFSPCLYPACKDTVKLVFWGGATRLLFEAQPAGKLMFEYPDHIVCHAGSFYIGQPVPTLGIRDELAMGETYFVIPIDRLSCNVLTAASLASLSAAPKGSTIDFGKCPFEYMKGAADGKTLIKVSPQFITRIITAEGRGDRRFGGSCSSSSGGGSSYGGFLCNTPELQKHYSQLVGQKAQQWSPKLETISESKARLSPSRLLGLEHWR